MSQRPETFEPFGAPPQHRLWLVLLFAAAALYSAAIPLVEENQALLSAGVLLAVFAIARTRRWMGDFSRLAVIVLGGYLSLRYWMFRTTETLSYTGFWDFAFLMLLYLAETYGILTHLVGLFVNVVPIHRHSPALPRDESRWPTVDVLVPTYNEPVELVNITLTACTQLDYPREKLNIFVLDDGGTDEKCHAADPDRAAFAQQRARQLKAAAAALGVHYLTRENNLHAKAGNINAALRAAVCRPGGPHTPPGHDPGPEAPRPCGELVLVLDCDHVPTKDFLKNTVGFFSRDEKLACVQTPHFFINPTPVEKNLDTVRDSPGENEMFYGGIQPGLDFWNASFFCGSAAVLRRRFLMEIGGFVENTITEDAGTALEMHGRGLNSVYFNKAMTMGLSPESFDDFIIQRSRWAKGMTQILLLKNPLGQKGLTPSQRLCYLNACLFWLFGFARIIFFLSPLFFLLFSLRVYNASLTQVLVYAVPHLLASYFVSNFLYGKLRHPFYSELFEIIQSIYLIPAVVSVFRRPRAPRFRVTPKATSRDHDNLTHLSTPFYLMFLLNLLAYCAGGILWLNQPTLLDTIVICLCWNTFNMFLVICCLGVVWERRQLRRSHRYETAEQVALRDPESGEVVPATLRDLSTTGIGLLVRGRAAPAGGRLTLLARDSYGNRYELPLEVLRVLDQGGRQVLGCRFDAADEQTRGQVIGFVYGDSARWKYFAEHRPVAGVGTLRSLFNLVRTGLRGSGRNMAGLAKMAVRSLRPAAVK